MGGAEPQRKPTTANVSKQELEGLDLEIAKFQDGITQMKAMPLTIPEMGVHNFKLYRLCTSDANDRCKFIKYDDGSLPGIERCKACSANRPEPETDGLWDMAMELHKRRAQFGKEIATTKRPR